jgi:hypothetical protein
MATTSGALLLMRVGFSNLHPKPHLTNPPARWVYTNPTFQWKKTNPTFQWKKTNPTWFHFINPTSELRNHRSPHCSAASIGA